MKAGVVNRRQLIVNLASGAAIVGLASCGKGGGNGLACATADTLTTGQRAARDGRKYVEVSQEADKNCLNCEFFKPAEGGCGDCAIDGMPANPSGFCTSWSVLTTAHSPESRRNRKA